MTVEDVDLDQDVVYVLGKGRRERACPFGRRTAMALDRYLRQRSKLGHARQADASWPSTYGVLNASGLATMLRRRGQRVGIGSIHPHQLRHTFAHSWLANGGNEGDLMRSQAGERVRCSAGTRPAPPTSAFGTRTVVSPRGTGSDVGPGRRRPCRNLDRSVNRAVLMVAGTD